MKGFNLKASHFIIIVFTILSFVGCKPHESRWQGYNEGKLTYISSNNSAIIQQLFVTKGKYVKKNTPLVVLEEQPQSDEYNKVKANLTEALAGKKHSKAALELAQTNYQRDLVLINKHAIDTSEFDKSHTNYIEAQATDEKADANIVAAQAALPKSQWHVNQNTLLAPKDSLVFDTYFLEGELPPAGKPILSLLAPDDIKAIFFVSEKELGSLKLGQKVTIECDGCQQPIPAILTYISSNVEYTPPVIYSDQTRTELVFRVEAKPLRIDMIELHPGQP